MGLTARPIELIAASKRQLKSVGIDFAGAAFSATPLDLKTDAPARFEDGVVYVGAYNNKGATLVAYLEQVGRTPKKIVFVDNKAKHVEAVEKALGKFKIDYLGCRHAASDAKVNAFDPAIADIQYRFFRKILDDPSARRLLP
jgi:hypothetical protein